jgi:hypothetical protein
LFKQIFGIGEMSFTDKTSLPESLSFLSTYICNTRADASIGSVVDGSAGAAGIAEAIE